MKCRLPAASLLAVLLTMAAATPTFATVTLATVTLATGVTATGVTATGAAELPVPPRPPARPPSGEIAAMPNFDAHAPVAPASDKPSIGVKLFRAKTYDPSLGFAPGSQYQTSEDRKMIQTPGFSVSVPLR